MLSGNKVRIFWAQLYKPTSIRSTRATFRKIVLAAPVLLFSSTGFTYNIINAETDQWKWHQATVLGSFVAPRANTGLYWKLEAAPGREKLAVRLWKTQAKSRGLYLVLPGTTGDSSSTISNYLGELIANQGYDAMVLANPFSQAFQVSFSSDGYVGFPFKDINDMVTMLDVAMRQYRSAYGQPKTVALLGSSLGGTYAVMMAHHPNKFKINKFIALHPPVDFQHGIDVLDNAIQAKLRLDFTDIPGIFLNRIWPVTRMTDRGLSVPLMGRLGQALGDDEVTNKALIGGAFQIELKKITKGIVKTPFYSQRDRNLLMGSRMSSITFSSYLGYAGVGISKNYPLNGTVAEVLRPLDLRSLLKRADNKENIYVVHSEDDFLLRSGDLGDLDRILGKNLIVFHSGGHCGVDWTPTFARTLVKIIQR